MRPSGRGLGESDGDGPAGAVALPVLGRADQPAAACRAVLVGLARRPGRLASPRVSFGVRRACARAGIGAAGAHRLRHAAAVGMLAAGGTLAEIGQVLRQRSLAATSLYAKG